MQKSNITNLTFRDFIRPLFRQKIIILISFLVIVPITCVGLLFRTPVYEAKVLIHIKGVSHISSPTYERLGSFQVHLTQMVIAKSNPVIKRAVKALSLDKRPLDYENKFCHPLKKYWIDLQVKKMQERIADYSPEKKEEYLLWKAMSELKVNIQVYLEPHTDIFAIVVRDYDPQKAIEIANVVSRSYTIYDLQQQLAELTLKYGNLHPTVQQLQDNIRKMTANLTGNELSDIDSIGTASVKIIQQASTNFESIGKSKSMLMIIGIILSGLVGAALALIFDMLNHTLKTPDDLVQFLNIAAIGSIPKKKFMESSIIKDTTSGSTYVEFYNDLSDQVNIFMKVQKIKILLLMSFSTVQSNTNVTTNLGICLSHNVGIKTLVIDANVSNPVISKLLNLEKKPGLANFLENQNINIDSMINEINPNLHVIQTGVISENTITLLNESIMKQLTKKMKNRYKCILIDCSNIKKLTDITILSSCTDGMLCIVNEGKDHIQVTKSIVDNLNQNKANIIGGILNNRTFPIPTWLYKRV